MTDNSLSPQDALVAVMVAVSVSDETIRTAELVKIEQIVNNLPSSATTTRTARGPWRRRCSNCSRKRTGSTRCSGSCTRRCPNACGKRPMRWPATWPQRMAIQQTELRFLEELRHALNIDRLHAAAIERGARARHMTLYLVPNIAPQRSS
jgi:hypothetical protein